MRIEKRRACERLLQISIVDIAHLLVAGLGLGLPAEEKLFEKLARAGVLSKMVEMAKRMKDSATYTDTGMWMIVPSMRC